jgi:hypothetical protein
VAVIAEPRMHKDVSRFLSGVRLGSERKPHYLGFAGRFGALGIDGGRFRSMVDTSRRGRMK